MTLNGVVILYFSAFPIKTSTPNPYCIHEQILSHLDGVNTYMLSVTFITQISKSKTKLKLFPEL